jgi:hypothetical protein
VREIARLLAEMPAVRAVAMGGSRSMGRADPCSDVDLYVYSASPPPVELRAQLAMRFDSAPEIDNQAFGPGDEWRVGVSGPGIDIMYWSPIWIEEQLARVLVWHAPSVGYSTAIWRTVATAVPLEDPAGWFAALQETANQPYPEPLRQAIITQNWTLLRDARSSFFRQLSCAVDRGDTVSVQHRTSALLASYFDVLFAFNRVLHPGEKRLLTIARAECAEVPNGFEEDVRRLLTAAAPGSPPGDVLPAASALVSGLGALIRAPGQNLCTQPTD